MSPSATTVPAASAAQPASASTAVARLRRTATIRAHAQALLSRARAGRSAVFAVHDARLNAVADFVAEVTRQRYPDLQLPYHSRWRHFEAGGVDRLASIVWPQGKAERARAQIDLAVVSVLLDAGAGAAWRYAEQGTGLVLQRSEGLGVASLHAFSAGLFSSDPQQPRQVDAAALRSLDPAMLAAAFQARPDNPLVGLDGRCALLRRLGDALAARPDLFGPAGRPGGLLDALQARCVGRAATAHDLLDLILEGLSPAWLADNRLNGVPLGDCWPLPALADTDGFRPGDPAAGWMPFHKLSQWLAYSLIEPLEWAGLPVSGLDELTGLPEYRNGGLLIDGGVLTLRDPSLAAAPLRPGDAAVIEWRALTVALLDELLPLVRARLERPDLPLACLLEGGTWAAGRQWAQQLRGGTPPLQVESDGTVF